MALLMFFGCSSGVKGETERKVDSLAVLAKTYRKVESQRTGVRSIFKAKFLHNQEVTTVEYGGFGNISSRAFLTSISWRSQPPVFGEITV